MTGSLETMVSYVKGRANVSPATAVVLGSGLGHMAENVEGGIKVPYGDIPGYPQPTVEGHSGELILGNLRGEKVVMAIWFPFLPLSFIHCSIINVGLIMSI